MNLWGSVKYSKARLKKGGILDNATNKQKTDISKIKFPDALPEILDKLQTVSDVYLEEYNEHAAFDYMIAELFETTHEDVFIFTDGQKDGGIDFYIKDSPMYTIYQCKCPEIDVMNRSIPQTFDQDSFGDLMAGIDMLLDKSGDYDVKNEIKRLRSDFQRDYQADQESTKLTAVFSILGELTDPARKAFEAKKNTLIKKGVILKLVDWRIIYQTLHALGSPADVDFEIQVNYDDPSKDLLSQNDYCYVLTYRYDFYEAFRQHEWNLFEWNVRFQIHNSPINRRIVSTLTKLKGRKNFHHYNNGLLITCKNYRRDDVRHRLKLIGPQIVNGCQTVRSICEAYENMTPEDQKHFRETVRLQVKIIKTTDPEFINELVISTNDQNPMNPRNLKSNSAEQRDIQLSFRTAKWFYERKDGEFKSLLSASSQVRWFRRSDYAVGKRYKVMDNQGLAKAWLAFIGRSERALRGGVNYFEDEPEGIYSLVFKSTPSPAFWSAIPVK